jgi:DNA-binding transcriptional ArsR family regulator
MSARDHQDRDELSPTLRALADPTRLKIMLMLEGKDRTVGEIVDFFELSQPTISRHLQSLTVAGLVRRQKKGQRVYYGINTDSVRDMCITLAGCFPCCCMEVTSVTERKPSSQAKSSAGAGKRTRRKSGTLKPGGKRR